MNPLQRQNLLHILNQMPLITEKYQDVLADGSLKKASGLTPWQNL
jgi:hypothetical protein